MGGHGHRRFRLDAVKHIYHNAYNDENPTFLKKFYDRMNDSYHANGGQGDFYMVGEMLDDGANAAPYYKGLPALFEFSFWYKLSWALQNGIGRYFVKDILAYQPAYRQYRSDYIEATKLSNHDEDRTATALGRVEGTAARGLPPCCSRRREPLHLSGRGARILGVEAERRRIRPHPDPVGQSHEGARLGSTLGQDRQVDADRSDLRGGAGRGRRIAAEPLPHLRPVEKHLPGTGRRRDDPSPGL